MSGRAEERAAVDDLGRPRPATTRVPAALPTTRGIPANVHLDISFDQSSYIRKAVKSLEHEALQGGPTTRVPRGAARTKPWK
jgi:hypothetical protein